MPVAATTFRVESVSRSFQCSPFAGLVTHCDDAHCVVDVARYVIRGKLARYVIVPFRVVRDA